MCDFVVSKQSHFLGGIVLLKMVPKHIENKDAKDFNTRIVCGDTDNEKGLTGFARAVMGF